MLKSVQNSRNAARLWFSPLYGNLCRPLRMTCTTTCLWGSILPLVSLTFLKPVEKKLTALQRCIRHLKWLLVSFLVDKTRE